MLRQRAGSAIVLVPILLVVLALGEPFVAAVVIAAVAFAGVETFRLLAAAGYPSLPALGVVVAIGFVGSLAAPADLAVSPSLVAGLGIVVLAVGAFGRTDPREGFIAWAMTVFGAFYVGLLGFVEVLGRIAPALPSGVLLSSLGAERGWLLLLVLGVWAYDTGAYFVGRRFGRRRFLIHISPSKTYAGLVGGLIAATLVAAAMLWGLGQPPPLALLLGPLIAASAQAGDLAESMLKRAAGAKDSGTLIPGHGGMLDRVDSFLFAAPAVTLYVLAFVH